MGPGIQGDCDPRLNKEQDESYWLSQSGALKAKLDNKKPQGTTVSYDALLQVWKEGKAIS